MRKLKAAIVGCGGIAQVHAGVLHELEAAELTAFADIKPERAQALQQKYGGRAYASLEEMLAAEELDVLHVCTPHYLHVPMILAGVEKGLAVFSEKPPVINEAQWQQLEALSGKAEIGFCFQNRCNPETRLLHELMASGKPGRLLGARAFVTWRREAPYYTESGWRGALSTEGGGVLINQSIHTLDLLSQFMGKADRVDATLANHHLKEVIEVEDTLEARIDFGGKPGIFFATTGHCADSPVLLELVCEHCTLRMEEHEVTLRWADGTKERRELAPLTSPVTGKSYWGASHGLCIADFYDHLLTGAPFYNDIPGVTEIARLMLATYRSAREGREIVL